MKAELGAFEVASGKLVIADPCYRLDENSVIMGVIAPARQGTWHAQGTMVELDGWGDVYARLLACHVSVQGREEELDWLKCPFFVGVDSGQAGIFDHGLYRRFSLGEEREQDDGPWYEACCDLSTGDYEAGVLAGGAVSRSGIGDGAYGAYVAYNERQEAVAVKIVFIKRDDV